MAEGTKTISQRPTYDIASLSPAIGEHRNIPECDLAKVLNELLPKVVAYHRAGGCKPQWIVPDCLIHDHVLTRMEPCRNNAGEHIGEREARGPILVNVDCGNGGDRSQSPEDTTIHARMEWAMTKEDHGSHERREQFTVRGPAGTIGEAIVARLQRNYHPNEEG